MVFPDHRLPRGEALSRINDAIRQSVERLNRRGFQTHEERRFLLSLVTAEPEWAFLDIPHVEKLPGVRWKLQNLERLRKANARKFAEQSEELARRLA